MNIFRNDWKKYTLTYKDVLLYEIFKIINYTSFF